MWIWPLDRAAAPLLVALLGATLACTLGFVWTEELWWYLASGQRIADTGGIPERDPFLYSLDPPAPWLLHSWLWTLLLATLERAVGLGALPVLGSALVTGIVVLVYTRARIDRYGLVNALFVALVLVVGLQRFSLRAELLGWLLLALFVVMLERERLSPRGVVVLCLLQALWANVHAGFVLGLVVGGLYTLAALVQGPLTRRWPALAPVPGTRARAGVSLVWVLPALLLASLATTPRLAAQRLHDSVEVLQRAVAGLSSKVAMHTEVLSIVEWRSSLDGLFGLEPWLFGLCGVLGVASFAATARPLRAARLLLFLATGALAAWAVRFLPGFAIATALVALANLGDRAPWLARRLGRLWAAPARAAYQLTALLFVVFVLATGVALWSARAHHELGQSSDSGFTLNPRHVSPGAARYILAHDLQGPIFNDQAIGGYLVRHLHPEHQLYIDGRILDYALLAEHARVLNTPAGWRRAERKYGFRTVVLGNQARAFMSLRSVLVQDPDWHLVHLDPHASVFVRAEEGEPLPPVEIDEGGGEAMPFGAALESGWVRFVTRPFLGITGREQLGVYLGVLLQLERFDAVIRMADRAIDRLGEDEIIRAHRAFALFERGRLEEAERDFRRVAELRPEDLGVLRNHALVLRRMGRQEESQEVLRKLQALQ